MDIDDQAPSFTPVRTAAPWALGVFAILLVLFFFRAAPLSLDPPRSTNAPDQFDVTRALERLARVDDGTPHPVDSAALDATRTRLLQEITSLGYEPKVRDDTACRGAINGSAIRCARVQNIYFTAGPAEGPALVLTAHYDSVEAGPGFGDDGVGVAVWLEVAHQLKQSPPAKPVMFLLTDGEETALLGAQAFVNAKKEYGHAVGRIINLEARGNRGPAMMFETGHPNASIVGDWAKSGARPVANSMMTAVYELLPNSTDLTVHLHDGSNGVNIATADGLDFYHTNHDDLAHLDRASVQHMGDQALGAARAFLAADWSSDKTAGDIAYADVGTRLFVSLPAMFALVLLGLCFGVAAMMLVRPTRDGGWQKLDWRALVLPPALVVVSGILAFGIQALVGVLRPEPGYWTAVPQALNMTIFIATLLASTLALGWLAPNSKREALYASGWFWLLIVGMGLSVSVSGFSMIFLMPGVVFVLAGGAAWLFPRYQLIAYAIASAMLMLVFFPLIHLVDVMMGLGMAAMFGVLEALVLAPILGLIGGLAKGRIRTVTVLGGALILGVIATAIVPAYSVDRPLSLNFTAHYDIDARKAALFASQRMGALPKDVAAQLKIDANPSPPGAASNLASRTLNFTDRPFASATVVSDETAADGKRTIRLKLSAPNARMVRLRIPADAHPVQLSYGGQTTAMKEPNAAGIYSVDLVGRGSNDAEVSFTLAKATTDKKPEWQVQGFWTELPQDAGITADARPDTTVRYQMGDVSITTKKQAF